MIKEAYVSYEVARLLKKKGFDIPTHSYYRVKEEGCNAPDDWLFEPTGYDMLEVFNSSSSAISSNRYKITAPTHQMAMAWLREKEIQISIEWCVNGYYGYIINNNDEGSTYILDTKDSYEDAVDAALKYVLENLI